MCAWVSVPSRIEFEPDAEPPVRGQLPGGGGAVVRGHASADVVSEGVCGGGMQCVLGPSGLSGEQK